MGPNPSLFGFVKHVMRDSFKEKEVLANHGGGEIEGSGSSFGKNYGTWHLFTSHLTIG
jgi:hypothetical protein